MGEALNKWYIEQLTAPALMNRNAVRSGHWKFQWWREGDLTRSITYAEAWRMIKKLASGLMETGFEKGDRAAVMCHTCPEWVWADYAILSAGGVTVSVYPTLSQAEMSFILSDSGTKVIFLQSENLPKIREAWKSLTSLEKVVVLEENFQSDDPRILSLKDLRERGSAALVRDPLAVERRWRSVDLFDYMTIVYTSGTTGQPKGAVHTHFSFNSAVCRDLKDAPEYREGDVLLSFLPLSHTYERECGHGAAMMAAVTIAYSTPKTIVEDLQLFRPMIFMSVPRIYERIYMAMRDLAAKSALKKKIFDAALRTGIQVVEARSDRHGFIDIREGTDLTEGLGRWLAFKYRLFDRLVFSKVRDRFGGRFRGAFSAAGSLPADLCKVFLAMGIVVMEGYGLTETWNTITLNRQGKILPGSVGSPATGVEGRIAEDGEWQVRGDNLFSGYWNNPEATREAFTEDGFYKTGDIVEHVADGYVKIVDRKKGIMVLDTGKNVPSARIESLFSLSKYIDLVFPIGDDRKFVSAIVVPNFDAFIELFREKGITFDQSALEYAEEGAARVCVRAGEDFVNREELRQVIDEEIARANRELEEYERIKKYLVLSRKMTETTGEMTPTLKIKRKAVLTNFKEEINGLYK